MRFFLDANVLFSAAKSDGAARQLLKLLLEEGHVLVADAFVIDEARRNLARKDGGAAVDALDRLLCVVESNTLRAPVGAELTKWLPEKDRLVLCGAMALKCDVLVTGDKTHFGAGYGQVFGGVTLLSPAGAAALLRNR